MRANESKAKHGSEEPFDAAVRSSPTLRQKILIVDDRAENLFALEKTLSVLDVDIVKATSGNEALAATLEYDFAAAILDIMMPEMNGYELAEHLRGDKNTQVLPIVFLTASYADEHHQFKGYDAGGVDYIVKPSPPQILLAKIRVFLEIDRYRRGIEAIVEERTERIRNLNAVLRSIRNVNQIIVTERRRDRLLQPICDGLTQTRGFLGAWCVLTDGLPEVVEGAHAGFKESSFSLFTEMFKRGERPVCCGQVSPTQPVVVECNRLADCTGCPFADAFPDSAAMTVGLASHGKEYGCLGVCVPSEYADDEEEQSLLLEIAGDVAFALYSIEIEAARDTSQRTVRAIFDAAKDGILLADAETRRFAMANSALCEMLGYSFDELQDMTVAAIHPPEDLTRVDAKFEKQLRGESTLALNIPVKRKDGSVFFADINSVPIDLGGRTHLLGILRDITDRMRHEGELRKSEENYRLLADNTVDCIWLMDLDTTFRYLNPACLPLLGYTPEEMLGTKLTEYCDEANFNIMAGEIQNALEAYPDFKSTVFEAVMRRRDGTEIPVEITGKVLVDDQGAPVALQGVARDIGERRSLEAQLRQAQKMEAIGQLAGGVAHDFNNILQAMLGYSAMLTDRFERGSEVHEFATEIGVGAERAAALTRQLLAFSRRQALELEDLDINEVAQGLSKMLERIIGESILVDIKGDPRLGMVHADWGQIEQVLMNLCVNSRDAMPDGGTVTIETENVEIDQDYCAVHSWARPGRYALLKVSDTGCGMDKETMNRIFEPFFTTKELGKGTGLGLATVYGVVRQHNGMIQVYTEIGQGTVFKIYLPAVDRATRASKRKRESLPVAAGDETVLLAEDDSALRTLTKRILEGAGYAVLLAEDGEEAINVFNMHSADVDLVLLDVVMPKGGAITVYDALRKLRPELRFLITSGYSNNPFGSGSLPEGVPFIQKPYAPHALLRKVREVLDAPGTDQIAESGGCEEITQ